jgi:Recombination protein U.
MLVMAKNTGKPSENAFEAALNKLGKRAYYCRLVDAAEIFGRVGKTGNVRPQPSDYIITVDGVTSYAEVKSTTDETAFRFSLLRTKQTAAARQILSAGGEYNVFVHHLPTDRWYRIPYSVIATVQQTGKASIKWHDLQDFQWEINSTTSWSTLRQPEQTPLMRL